MANEYFGKVSEKGIQIIPVILQGVGLATLATETGIIVDGSSFQATTKGFLVKKIHLQIFWKGPAAEQPIIVGVCGNDSGVSGGFAAGVLAPLLDPNDREAYLTVEEIVKTVWHETTRILVESANQEGATLVDYWVSVGGGKGIPCPSGAGPEVFAFNAGVGTLTTGSSIEGLVTYYGVWMED